MGTDTTTTTAKKALFMCQRPLCAKPYIRAATGAGIANDVLSSSLLCQTTAKTTNEVSTPVAMMSRAIAPPTAAPPTAATPATPAAVQVQSQINIKSLSLPNTIPTTTITQTKAPLVLSAPPPLPLPTPTTNRSVLPPNNTAPAAHPTLPAVSVTSTSFVPYRTYAYQQVQASSSVVLPTTATARMNIATTTYRNPITQQRLTLWKQQQLIEQQQQQVQRLAHQQQQQIQQRAQQQQRIQHQTPQGHRLCTVQQQQQQRQQQYQRQQQGIYHSDDDDSHILQRTRRRCPLSQPPQLPTTILK